MCSKLLSRVLQLGPEGNPCSRQPNNRKVSGSASNRNSCRNRTSLRKGSRRKSAKHSSINKQRRSRSLKRILSSQSYCQLRKARAQSEATCFQPEMAAPLSSLSTTSRTFCKRHSVEYQSSAPNKSKMRPKVSLASLS